MRTARALAALAAADGVLVAGLVVLGPEIARTLGLAPAAVAALLVLHALLAAAAALPLVAALGGRPRRAAWSLTAAGTKALAAATAGLAGGPWTLVAAVAADGSASSARGALHPALLVDAVPAGTRVRALATLRAGEIAGAVAAPVLLAVLTTAGLTWRGALLGLAGLAALAVLAASRLRDPGVAPTGPLAPGVTEVARAVLRVPTARRLLVAVAWTGAFAAPLGAFLPFFLEERFGLGPAGRAVLLAAAGSTAVLALALWAPAAERAHAAGPERLVARAWPLLLGAVAALLAALAAPSTAVVAPLLAVAASCSALLGTAVLAVLLGVVPAAHRTATAALSGIAAAGVGGVGGLLLLGGTQAELGTGGSLALLAVPGAVAALVLRSAVADASADAARASAPLPPPAHGAVLEARGLSFAYDGEPVLDGLTLTLAPGELVALLGTNGAGKSTLLRLLAGFEAPAAGVVRLAGADVTLLAPERRADAGLLLVSGEVPGALTVRQALELGARAGGLPMAAADAALAGSSWLAARARVPAAALSGGEQRLLAIALGVLRRPRVLLVDEASAGLAPEVLPAVLAALRTAAGDGTAVLAVAQDAALAARMAPRAVFLERGRLVFDGPVGALPAVLARPVLLRTDTLEVPACPV